MPTSYGTKVTDPNAIVKESAGPVASDSLAAESTRSGGGFAENRGGEPLGVSGSNSTFANTNTSGATRLDPASDAEARQAQEDWAEEKKLGSAGTYPDALGGQAKGLAVENTQRSGTGGSNSGNGATAPSYVSSQYIKDDKPKGQNLTEGGFDSNDSKNASFTTDIGSKNDPGRLAEQKFQRENMQNAGDAGFPRDQGAPGGTTYDALGGDTAA